MSKQRKHDESAAIAISATPQTRHSLAADLRALGVQAGMTLLVHSSLSKVGYVVGGAISLILALQDALTPGGTLVMPAFSSHLSDPAQWQNPPVPEAWWQIIRDHTPAFDPAITPTRGIGILPELFRTFPNVRRSYHPMDSFSAWGKHAAYITADHSLARGLGDGSPLAKLYALDGYTLMIGTTYETNTIFHLGEYRAPNPPLIQQGSPILRDGQPMWAIYEDVEANTDHFEAIGADFEAQSGVVRVGKVGLAETRLFPGRAAVDFAEAAFTRLRAAQA